MFYCSETMERGERAVLVQGQMQSLGQGWWWYGRGMP
jgi:hypothetical protein